MISGEEYCAGGGGGDGPRREGLETAFESAARYASPLQAIAASPWPGFGRH